MSPDHLDLAVERLTPGRQLSPFAARSRTILLEGDHADELDPPSAALARRMTDQTVVASNQAVPASLS